MRALLGAIACMLCIGLLVSVAVESGGTKLTMTVMSSRSMQGNSREKPFAHHHLKPFFSSKRRVPNGPDPIHNRRAGKSARPPGRA